MGSIIRSGITAGGPNFNNKTIFTGDNLHVMRGMNDGCINLIYLDPPFNSNATYGVIFGGKREKEIFKDVWTFQDVDLAWWKQIKNKNKTLYSYLDAVRTIHTKSLMSYLIYMAVRLIEMERILKPIGSIYLHCDPTASHYLKHLMDAIFGHSNFRDEIVWQRAAGRAKGSQHESRSFGRDCDYILHYSKTDKYIHNEATVKLSGEEMLKKFPHVDEHGRRYHTGVPIFRQPSMGARPNLCYTYNGVTNPHPSGWRVSKERLQEMDANGEIIWREGKRPLRKSFAENYKGKPIGCLWMDIPNVMGDKRTGFDTQKPVPLLKRIIKASSNEGDWVFDPFCGCATTLVAAQLEERNWVGVDISPEAAVELEKRLGTDCFTHDFHNETNLPIKSNAGKLKPYNHPSNITELYGRQAGYCFICYKHREVDLLTVDHIEPQSRGGSDHINNLQLVCQKCNSAKGNKSYEEAIAVQWKKDGTMWEKRKHEAEQAIHKLLGGQYDRKL